MKRAARSMPDEARAPNTFSRAVAFVVAPRLEMNPTDYRRDFAAYFSAVERERFEQHAGLKSRAELRAAEERYGGLWTRAAVEELRREREETPGQFETERAGLVALEGAASIRHAEEAARAVTEELRRCVEAPRIEWGGANVAFESAPDLLADERDAARRRELASRWLDAGVACEDLRGARREALDVAVRSLGFDGRRTLYESFTGAKLEDLLASAEVFLRRTEAAFTSGVARWAARELPPGGGAPVNADQFFFGRAARFDAHFPARDLRALYQETLAGLGVRVGSQRNLRVDAEPRPAKSARPRCFAVRPPDDVRLVFGARASGLDLFRQTFYEGGQAQMFAWASRDASMRHPEFVYAPDAATEEGHGRLLSGLFDDPSWLTSARRVRETDAREAARFSALLDLHAARRDCARLRFALALESAGGAHAGRLAEEHVTSFDEATGFRYQAGALLLEVGEWFASATSLRSRLFAVGLREHLRSRHGRRWFASRAAGEELVDIWNTASRYRVEELARLVWGGQLSFELLADESLAALNVEDGI
jgi:hypothetical protein